MKVTLVADAGFTNWWEELSKEIQDEVDEMLHQYGAYGVTVEVTAHD